MIKGLTRIKNRSSIRILSHIRNKEYDLQKALESNVDGVNILCTVDPERLSSMNLTLQQYMDCLKKNILLAKKSSGSKNRSGEFFLSAFKKKFHNI